MQAFRCAKNVFQYLTQMKTHHIAGFAFALALAGASIDAAAQFADSAARIAAQREALAPLGYMDGVWRGPASTTRPSGEKHTIVQTERIGPFLGGTLKVFEGRGYGGDGEVSFNALGILSYDVDRKSFSLRSYAMGHAGDFPVTLRPDGFTWVIPQGPSAKIVYTATVTRETWHEVGDRIVEGRPAQRFFEMTLKRVGDTDWPAANPIPPK
jgi:hypothetical protein